MHVAALRQALVMLAVSVAAAAAAAGLWSALGSTGFRVPLAVSLMVTAGLLCLAGGSLLPRLATARTFALMGREPDSENSGRNDPLTAIGVFCLVALPLFAAGLVLYGRG